MLKYISVFVICMTASALGAVCGVGGGIVIKPLLDFMEYADAATCSFLSGCTVLSMSACSMLRIRSEKDNPMEVKKGLPLAVGAATGGVCGKVIFDLLKNSIADMQMVASVQAVVLGLTVIGCMAYTMLKTRISPMSISSHAAGAFIGFLLGNISSFLGIGGGPINLVALHYFYGYTSKSAVKYSLLIILLSQITNLLTAIFTRQIPNFNFLVPVMMMTAGICGGIIGRKINEKIDNKRVDKLFLGFLAAVLCICMANVLYIF